MTVRAASVVGIPSKTSWSSTLQLKMENLELYGAVSFVGDERAPHEGRRFVRYLEERRPATPAECYQTLTAAYERLPEGVQASWGLLIITTAQVVFMTSGYGMVALVRDGQQRWLADGTQQSVVLEGELQDGDVWIAMTAQAKDVQSSIPDPLPDPDSLVSHLIAQVQQHIRSGEIALLAVKISFGAKTPLPIAVTNQVSVEPNPQLPQDVNEARLSPTSQPVTTTRRVTYLLDPERVQKEIAAQEQQHLDQVPVKPSLLFHFPMPKSLRPKGKSIGRWLIPVAVVAMVVLGGAWWWSQQQAVKKEYSEVIVPLQTIFDQIKTQSTQQKNEARQAAQSLLDREKSTKISRRANQAALTDLQAKTTQLITDISGQKAVVNLPIFYDFRLVAANFLAHSATRIQDTAVFLDSSGDRIIQLDLSNKTNQTLSAEGVTGAKDIAGLSKNAIVVDGKTVKRIPLGGTKPETMTTLNDIQEATLIDSFGDTLYVFDKSAQQLWKAPMTQGATAAAWIRSAKGVKLDTITSLAINGSVWMGANDGMIYRFVRGERQNFAPQSLLEPFSSTLLIAVNAEGEKLVAAEPAKQRLVIMDKEGVYQQQINSPQIGAVTDVFLSSDEKSVYLVAGSVVYRVEI